jgi:hypothetical protein
MRLWLSSISKIPEQAIPGEKDQHSRARTSIGHVDGRQVPSPECVTHADRAGYGNSGEGAEQEIPTN